MEKNYFDEPCQPLASLKFASYHAILSLYQKYKWIGRIFQYPQWFLTILKKWFISFTPHASKETSWAANISEFSELFMRLQCFFMISETCVDYIGSVWREMFLLLDVPYVILSLFINVLVLWSHEAYLMVLLWMT